MLTTATKRAVLRAIPVIAVMLCLLAAGCTKKFYKESADRQVEGILSKKSKEALGTAEKYEIEQMARDPLAALPRAAAQPLEVPENLKRAQEPPQIISLQKALEITFYNSRDYQSQKEDVYLTALSLTEQRHQFSAQFSGTISSLWSKGPGEENWDTSTNFGVSKLLKDGAQIGINLSSDFLRNLTGDPSRTAASILAVKIIQPLWRGAGRAVVTENLTQSERDVIYSVRSFARFQRTFAVSIASSYYRVLQQRDVVRNQASNYQNLIAARERTASLAEAGRLPEFQVDQARQNELSAKNDWIDAIQQYYEALDNLKIDLGLPTDANVDLDDADLQALMQAGIQHPAMSAEDAIVLALKNRLDLKNSEDRVADAGRKIKVAENGLGADVNLVFNSNTPTAPGNRAAKFEFDQTTWSAGLDVNLPLDRLAERNTYRTSLISLNRALRDYGLQIDNVKLSVRTDWRILQQAKESYEIQKNSVELAKRRVESTTLLLQAGRAQTRDLLDAQSSLVNAQNALTAALINHLIARLQFFRDIETLTVDEKGVWHEEPPNAEPAETGPVNAEPVNAQPTKAEPTNTAKPASTEAKDEPQHK
jgi:outer membrane protein TolC